MSSDLFQEIRRQTLQELELHGVHGWEVVNHTTSNRKLGMCDYANKRIHYNMSMLEQQNENVIINTMSHEIAHALTPGAGHGKRWASVMAYLGGNPKATVDQEDLIINDDNYPYSMVCGNGHKAYYVRRPRSIKRCLKCNSNDYGVTIMYPHHKGTALPLSKLSSSMIQQYAYARKRSYSGELWFDSVVRP